MLFAWASTSAATYANVFYFFRIYSLDILQGSLNLGNSVDSNFIIDIK